MTEPATRGPARRGRGAKRKHRRRWLIWDGHQARRPGVVMGSSWELTHGSQGVVQAVNLCEGGGTPECVRVSWE